MHVHVRRREVIEALTDDTVIMTMEPARSRSTLGTLTLRGDRGGDPFVVSITVVAAEQPHRFSFRWVYPPGVIATSQNSMLVTFTLTAAGSERTML